MGCGDACFADTSPLCCRDPEPFDWYQRYGGVKDIVSEYVKKDDNILMLGCGNSSASAIALPHAPRL